MLETELKSFITRFNIYPTHIFVSSDIFDQIRYGKYIIDHIEKDNIITTYHSLEVIVIRNKINFLVFGVL